MDATRRAGWFLEQEARALLTRLDRVRPFVLFETMVPAAAPAAGASAAIHAYLERAASQLRRLILEFLAWLGEARERRVAPARMQQRFTLVRLRFNVMLSHFDIFADVVTQRSEHETGVWLAGLDLLAADALKLPGGYYDAPALLCYLDRGHGAAIRRARTRLPGGGDNPVAVIRVPRERMVGCGIASSLVHEVGHQAATLLDLVPSLRDALREKQRTAGPDGPAWQLYERWISEIVADFWSVARIGVGSTLGLIGVVSLPRAFVFRIVADDPHPVPWIRVMLSARIGAVLFPGPQWDEIAATWTSLYPLESLPGEKRARIEQLLRAMDAFVALLVDHRPKSLRGRSLREVMQTGERTPSKLTALWRRWHQRPRESRSAPPTILFAVIGQARASGQITPESESRILSRHLARWAVEDALGASSASARTGRARTRDRRAAAETLRIPA